MNLSMHIRTMIYEEYIFAIRSKLMDIVHPVSSMFNITGNGDRRKKLVVKPSVSVRARTTTSRPYVCSFLGGCSITIMLETFPKKPKTRNKQFKQNSAYNIHAAVFSLLSAKLEKLTFTEVKDKMITSETFVTVSVFGQFPVFAVVKVDLSFRSPLAVQLPSGCKVENSIFLEREWR